MERLIQLLGVIGGSVGLLYAIGYFVLAAHSRVLGLPLDSADTATLLLNAWEFVIQGSLYVSLGSLQAISAYPAAAMAVAVVALATIAVFTQRRPTWSQQWKAIARDVVRRRLGLSLDAATAALIIVAALVVAAIQAYHVAAHVVPSAAVTSLLSVPAPYPPFPALRPSLQRFFQGHWDEVRTAIIGNGQQSDTRTLLRLYTSHVVLALLTSAAAALLWWAAAGPTRRKAVRRFVAVPALLGLLLCLYTPLYYGVTMKSYRYPLVRLVASDKLDDVPTSGYFARVLRTPEFLMQTTERDYVLYSAPYGEIHIFRRDLVGLARVAGDDFLFSK